ncbi:Sugar diacid regulator [Actinomyces bovis]|uniref:Sugar diacid regulator n=1 Tax=Actinomyces bovis TaxID=1658 RepID=A0ABY1VPS9_9ACTO|nr:helix-turn-helix domain-containing protein [Actinomyces bovis]SPT54138.1 Sugar diacid regulator [Actinomyces bovis]VEG53615.1 Sugar diacid regulator [Actinomyces israelii]
MAELSAPVVAALRNAQDQIVEHSLDLVSAEYPWYRTLPEASRRQIEAVARMGVTMFVDSVEDPENATKPSQIFSVAPATLTGTISLEQTLSLVRSVVSVVEEEFPEVVPQEHRDAVRILVLRFGRDIGFAAAQVYARAAEARGAWDARLESVSVDAMLHDSPQDAETRAGTAGWHGTGPAVAIAARIALDALAVSNLRRQCRSLAGDCLVSVRGDSVLVVMGSPKEGKDATNRATSVESRLDQAAMTLSAGLGDYAVVGPVVPGVAEAGMSLRSAMAGLRALPGWPEAQCPLRADDLLPERVLAGDPLAPQQLLALVHRPLREMGDPFEETVAAYLSNGRSLEATARALFVHANTVRYRLGRVTEQVGWDPTDPREGLMLHVAIIIGRLEAVGR